MLRVFQLNAAEQSLEKPPPLDGRSRRLAARHKQTNFPLDRCSWQRLKFVPMTRRNPAADRQRAKEAVTRALDRLAVEDRRVVLEDVLYGMVELVAKKPSAKKRAEVAEAVRHISTAVTAIMEPVIAANRASQPVQAEPLPFWMEIRNYCEKHPAPNGMFDPSVVGAALLPDEKPSKARTAVYLTVKRKSPQSDRVCREPQFEVSDNSFFRLLDQNTRGARMQ